MSRKEYCPKCKKAVSGLYQNVRSRNPSKQWKRRAYYCEKCNLVLNDNDIVYKKIIFEKGKL